MAAETDLETRADSEKKKGSNVQTALTVVGFCLGDIISSALMEHYFPGSKYMAPTLVVGTLTGGAIGYFGYKAYRMLKS